MDGEGENSTDALFDAGSGFGFIGQPVQDADDGRRLNLADGFTADMWENVLLQGVDDLLGVFFILPRGTLVGVPLACDFLKVFLLLFCLFPLLLVAVRVGILREQALCVTVQLPRLFQPDFWIYTQRQSAVLTVEAVTVTPVFAAARGDEQMQPATVKQLVGTFAWRGIFDSFFGQSHGGGRWGFGGIVTTENEPQKNPIFLLLRLNGHET